VIQIESVSHFKQLTSQTEASLRFYVKLNHRVWIGHRLPGEEYASYLFDPIHAFRLDLGANYVGHDLSFVLDKKEVFWLSPVLTAQIGHQLIRESILTSNFRVVSDQSKAFRQNSIVKMTAPINYTGVLTAQSYSPLAGVFSVGDVEGLERPSWFEFAGYWDTKKRDTTKIATPSNSESDEGIVQKIVIEDD